MFFFETFLEIWLCDIYAICIANIIMILSPTASVTLEGENVTKVEKILYLSTSLHAICLFIRE